MYNAMLCIYYLLVVKYNVRDEVIAKYEPHIHLISICPALITAVEKLNIVIKNQSSNNKKGQRNVTYAEVLTKNIGDNKKAQMTASGKNK